jgi:general secretion pathway protein I
MVTVAIRKKSRCRPKALRIFHPSTGFTLMEVMVAISVVAIALLAIYRMHTQTLFMDSMGRFDTIAPMLARQKLTEIETGGLNEFNDDTGDFGSAFPGYGWRIQSEYVVSDLLKDDGPLIKRIIVTVDFNGEEALFDLTTYRHLYE